MRLTVLGCSGTFPGPDAACSSYLVEHEGFRLVIDMGNGALGPLQRQLPILGVDAVLLSHLHGDHCLDLVAYSYARRYHPDGMASMLPVYGPAGTQDRLCRAFEVPPRDRLRDVYDFTVTAPASCAIGPFEVELGQVNHPIESHAIRLTAGGRTLAYSADTGVSDTLVRVARDADVFLCEASFLEGCPHPPNVHLTGKQAGEHASRAGARQLLLTHLVPWGDPARSEAEAAAAYDGPLELARPGAAYDV